MIETLFPEKASTAYTKYSHRDLVEIGYKWVLKNTSCGVAFKELHTANAEIPDVIGFTSWSSVVVEVKVSRADFLKDKKKPHRLKGMGEYRYYMCPHALIKPSELPERWGLIYVSESGKCTCVYNPQRDKGKYIGAGKWERDMRFERDLEAENRLMYSALRRLHIKGHIDCIYDKQYNYSNT